MQELYSEQALNAVSRKVNRRLAILCAALLVLLAVFVMAMITRTMWLAMVSACVAGCFAIFYLDLFCMPLIRYRRLVRSALSGRDHTKDLEFARVEPDLSSVEGVPCRSFIFLGEADKHGSREILLYWDNELPLPDLTPGETVTVKYTDKYIIGLLRGGSSSRL